MILLYNCTVQYKQVSCQILLQHCFESLGITEGMALCGFIAGMLCTIQLSTKPNILPTLCALHLRSPYIYYPLSILQNIMEDLKVSLYTQSVTLILFPSVHINGLREYTIKMLWQKHTVTIDQGMILCLSTSICNRSNNNMSLLNFQFLELPC